MNDADLERALRDAAAAHARARGRERDTRRALAVAIRAAGVSGWSTRRVGRAVGLTAVRVSQIQRGTR